MIVYCERAECEFNKLFTDKLNEEPKRICSRNNIQLAFDGLCTDFVGQE